RDEPGGKDLDEIEKLRADLVAVLSRDLAPLQARDDDRHRLLALAELPEQVSPVARRSLACGGPHARDQARWTLEDLQLFLQLAEVASLPTSSLQLFRERPQGSRRCHRRDDSRNARRLALSSALRGDGAAGRGDRGAAPARGAARRANPPPPPPDRGIPAACSDFAGSAGRETRSREAKQVAGIPARAALARSSVCPS